MSKKPAPQKPGNPSKKPKGPPRKQIEPLRPTKAPNGRPSIYTEALAEELAIRVALGRALSNVCEDADMPAEVTVYRWLLNDSHPGFRQKITRARELQNERFADMMIGLALKVQRTTGEGLIPPDRARVAGELFDKAARLRSEKQPKRFAFGGDPDAPPIPHADFTGWSAEQIAEYRKRIVELAAIAGA